jgi:hypothetical protein
LACLGWNCIPDVDLPPPRPLPGAGGLPAHLRRAGDYKLFIRLLRQERLQRIGRTLAGARRHDDAMSMDRNASFLGLCIISVAWVEDPQKGALTFLLLTVPLVAYVLAWRTAPSRCRCWIGLPSSACWGWGW